MNPENHQNQENFAAEKREKKSTSRQLLLAVETNIAPVVNKVTVSGMENIDQIPVGKKVVILTSHISDIDIPLVIKALGNDFDIAVSDQSTHHDLSQDLIGKISNFFAGQKNFVPIDYKIVDGEKQAKFNPDNFASMVSVLDSGKDLLVAAHNPSENGELTAGGVGGVYLSQLSDAIILPVAVDVKGEGFMVGKNVTKSVLNRPDANVIVGEPMELPHIDGIERYKEILDKRKNKEKLSAEEIAEFKSLTEKLREQSDAVMTTLAAMLPEEKRGVYGGE